MTTLKIALAQSPLRAAWTTAQHGSLVEVRAQLIERYSVSGHDASRAGCDAQSSGQQTWTRNLRYELLANGVPQMAGSYHEIVEIASHLRGVNGAWELDWQPVYDHSAGYANAVDGAPQASQAKGAQ